MVNANDDPKDCNSICEGQHDTLPICATRTINGATYKQGFKNTCMRRIHNCKFGEDWKRDDSQNCNGLN